MLPCSCYGTSGRTVWRITIIIQALFTPTQFYRLQLQKLNITSACKQVYYRTWELFSSRVPKSKGKSQLFTLRNCFSHRRHPSPYENSDSRHKLKIIPSLLITVSNKAALNPQGEKPKTSDLGHPKGSNVTCFFENTVLRVLSRGKENRRTQMSLGPGK